MLDVSVTDHDRFFMERALMLAEQAFAQQEVPVGAVVVQGGRIIGEGWNQPILSCDATAHAEVQALRAAGAQLSNYRLPDSTLYVTIEPCTMCAGAIVHARIQRVVFGALEPKAGALVSQARLFDLPHWNHKVEVVGGVLGERASELMQQFFKMRREKKRALKASYPKMD